MAQVDILLYYDTDLRKFTTEAGSITAVTKIQLGQLNTVDVVLAVIKDGVAIELTTPTWILGIKEINDQSGDYLIQATSATKTGTGTATRYTFTFTFDSTELRAFFETYDPTQDYLALEIRDTVNGIVTLPALIVDPVPAYTVEGTTPTDASGTLIVASGKTVNISNSITLTGTDSETYNLDTLADIPAVRYTASQGLTSQQQIDARANISVPSVTEMQAADGLLLAKASNLSDVASAATSRTNLGLGNVDNTSDANKPVSTATQTAIGVVDARFNQTQIERLIYPLIPTTLDGTYGDHFTGASLDAKWTRVGISAGEHVFQTGGGSWMTMKVGGAAPASPRLIHQAATIPTNCTITARCSSAQNFAVTSIWGIGFQDSSGNGIMAGIYTGPLIVSTSAWNYVGNLAQVNSANFFNGNSDNIWLRIRKVGTTYNFSFSYNGILWSSEIATTTATAMTRLSFGALRSFPDSSGDAERQHITIDYFDFTAQ